MTCLRSDVFCDWLDVTCAPSDSFVTDLCDWLGKHEFSVAFFDEQSISFRVGDGVLRVDSKARFHRASASGGVVGYLRSNRLFQDYVNVLGSVPHKVTRLDPAVDVFVDAPPVLRSLEARYPDDRFAFGRKSLKVTRLYSCRDSDGVLTGTWYAGHKSKARVTVRVYDKQEEALAKRAELLPPTVRYELTFSKDYGVSLWDALNPTELFYTHTRGRLLEPLKPVNTWQPRGLDPWDGVKPDTDLTIDDFDRMVSASPDLRRLVDVAQRFGASGEAILIRHFTTHLRTQNLSSDDAA